jgi:hypothetical protein
MDMDMDIDIPVHQTKLERETMETAPFMLNIVTEIQPEQNNLLNLINEIRGRSFICNLRSEGHDEPTIRRKYSTIFQHTTGYSKDEKYDPLNFYNDAVFKGVIFVIPAHILIELQALKTKNEIIEVLNHQSFIDSILGQALIVYDPSRKMAEIYDICVYKESGRGIGTILMTNVLDLLLVQFPNDALIWLGVMMGPTILTPLKLYTRVGFSNPYITRKTPIGSKWPKTILGLYRQNDYIDPDEINVEDVRILIEYIIEQYQMHNVNPKICTAYAYFKPSTGRYLRSLAVAASTQDIYGKISQKEIAGSVNLNKIVRSSGFLLFEIVADKKTISVGEGEAVGVVKSRYNYHTHPRSAYIAHNVRIAWPSAQDFVGFAESAKNFGTVFHLVVSLEGIYIIKLTKDFLTPKNIANLSTVYDEIKEKYNILYPTVRLSPSGQEISCRVAYPDLSCTGDEYVEIVNKEDFQIGPGIPRIFDVSFLSWNDVVKPAPFSFSFPRLFDANSSEGNCFVSEENMNSYTTHIPK